MAYDQKKVVEARRAFERGEIVVVIDRARAAAVQPAEVEARLKEALECHSMRDAAAEVSQALGLPRRQVYQMALRLAAGD